MSDRPHHRREDGDYGVEDEEDVEAYRKRRRQEDRKSRRSPSPPKESSNSNSKVFQSEREQRMARLRQEMRKEDEHLAALDEEQQRKQQEEIRRAEEAKPQESIIEVNPEELEGLDEEEQMRKLLGFSGFNSTKGELVEDNQKSAARGVAAKNKARKYRQYMNRKNGFNRPLEKMA
mmetsp:Transcript_42227/g.117563  ORF Transcript_42227/g.117563 Transcript_42227/m.117563 type:complete len:176 (+) Transcript_42227:233-760(+)|eukprot:CAMPEP_0176250954 /NCGR_PEP_ID=MMETSP0121_2-20121125/34750_1 /TAXON_ID=160619 /ORGANISM="Kryptoperidinium foliaceum, Strain CCMP 1326" /LENGTH=175 /DNA_ID=CAMNT_0017590683 /DNA_START=216 /DNA_END=739 /DNA_ORIENTATION=+